MKLSQNGAMNEKKNDFKTEIVLVRFAVVSNRLPSRTNMVLVVSDENFKVVGISCGWISDYNT